MANPGPRAALMCLFLLWPAGATAQSPASLWEDLARERPDAVRAAATARLEDLDANDPQSAPWLELVVASTCEAERALGPDTWERARRALALRQMSSPDSSQWVESFANLGRCHQIDADFPAAAEAFALAARWARRAELPPDRLAGHLRRYAHVLRILDELDAAGPLFDEAVSLQAGLDPFNPTLVTTLTQRARWQVRVRDFEAAAADADRARSVAEAIQPPDPARLGAALQSVGYVADLRGNLDRARDAFAHALGHLERAHGPDHVAVAGLLNRYSNHLAKRGDLEGARRLLERNLSIVRARFAPDHLLVTISLNNLASLAYDDGDFVTARKLYEQVLEARIAASGEAHPRVAFALENLASVHTMTGRFARARDLYQRTLEIYRDAYGPDDYQVGLALDNLGWVLMRLGRGEEAEAHFLAAIDLLPLPEDEMDLAHVLSGYGELLSETGRFAESEDTLRRALALVRANVGDDHPMVPAIVQNLGRLASMRGDAGTARGLLDEAVGLFTEVVGPSHPETGIALRDLARVEASLALHAGALVHAVEAERIAREHLRLLARGSSEDNALHFAAHRQVGVDLAVAVAATTGDPAYATAAWDAVIRSRALVFDELAQRRWAVQDSDDARLGEVAARLRAARQRLANLTVRGPEGIAPEVHRGLMAEARRERERAEEALADQSARFRRAQAGDRAGWDEVQDRIPDGAVLIGVARAEGERLVALVGRRDADPHAVDLGPIAPLREAIVAWRRAVVEGASLSGPFARNAERRVADLGEAVRRLAWDPLRPWVDDASLVFLVPEGPLHAMNPAALPHPEGGYLVEHGPTFHLLAAERDLLPVESTSGHGLLAMGGALFDAGPDADGLRSAPRDSCASVADLRFAYLPATEAEARAVAASWPEGARLHLGADANETTFKRDAPGRAVLHLATHGFFLESACATAALSPDPEGGLHAWASTPRRPVGNPLLATGLALTGANRRDAAAADDGILTGEEILELDLSAADWVVLSACDTGTGTAQAGEGLLGLRRSFQLAGARTLVTSLWPVDDVATRAWMEHLYRERSSPGRTTADAVRSAARAVLEERRTAGQTTHPFVWAAFVATGDWR